MTNNILNIYSDFIANYNNTPEYAIAFYENNSILLKNLNQLNDKESIKSYIEIISKYAEGLYSKKHWNLAIDIIDEKKAFIDKEIDRLGAKELNDVWYNSLSFVKGMASHQLKDYKTAANIFQTLVQIDKNNDEYKQWLSYSKYGLNLWILKTINIACLILIATGIVFGSKLPTYLEQSMLIVGVLGGVTSEIISYLLKRNFRKSKNTDS